MKSTDKMPSHNLSSWKKSRNNLEIAIWGFHRDQHVFCSVTSFILATRRQLPVVTFCLLLLQAGGSGFFRNVRIYLPNYTSSYPRRNFYLTTLSIKKNSVEWHDDIAIMNWKGSGWKWSWSNRCPHHPSGCLYGLGGTMKFLSQDNQCPGWESNPAPPDYKTTGLPIHQPDRKYNSENHFLLVSEVLSILTWRCRQM